ncbi:hypothetical protein [Flavobacterium adhaerens]|uniref:hypothetical protein n=1 Tax=Flavobacterium adhaerens TaxID=3149043 RepID=UPI0032B5B0B6
MTTNRLDNITGQYHSYVEDQVLTHYQLNETIDYFDDQNRLQNVFLTGPGITCGFIISTTPAHTFITISQGTGITTDGDLIKLQEKSADENKILTTKQKLFTVNGSSVTYKSFKPFAIDKANYAHFIKNNTILPLWELLPEKLEGEEIEVGEQPLTSFPDFANIKDYVIVLYLENYSKDASLCSQIDCYNQGREEVFNLKVLLASKASADFIISNDALFSKYNYFNNYQSLPELGVKKVVPTYNTSQTANQIKQVFNAVVSDNAFKNSLKNGISTLLTNLGFATEATTINTGITTLFNIVSIPNDIHYRYDALKDIVATYKELKDLYIQLCSQCNLPLGSFPKHLMIGLVEDPGDYKSYRHRFYKSSILDNENKTFKKFTLLVQRLLSITQKYGIIATANYVKITPSKTLGQLGQKSIPYYYNVDIPFLNSWDFDKNNIYMQRANLSYHITNLLNDDYVKFPLKYSLDDYDFYRIEGYLNDSIDDVNIVLNDQRNFFGLDFDFIIIDIIKDKNDLRVLLKNHPSFEHKAGVKKGGTLILLKEGGTFITDFAIDYKITNDNDLSCCTIVECIYPWISSLKYINNLSRSIKGTQSRVKAMPTHYLLNVRNYSINGVSLINQPVVIRVPLNNDLLLRRLHVVMEKINLQFPAGLVFDFIEEQKKLKITKLEKDKFVFEVQDITLNTNSPVYKFTETGISRNNRPFRVAQITTTIKNAYQQDVYKILQSNYAPVNKDDDYGRFNEDWRKWEILRSKLRTNNVTASFQRFITKIEHFDDIPTNIPTVFVRQELQQIAREIRSAHTAFANLEVSIGGDWTSGNWVNTTMMNHYALNSRNTNDDVVLFINLRKKLHNENGISKYIIHINNTSNFNLTLLTPIFNKYATKAEFYLQKPTGGIFIPIS